MFAQFDGTRYFIDLLALGILLLPTYLFVPQAMARRILLTLAGAYLLYFIAPRLLLFYAVFWSLVYVLQQLVARAGAGSSMPLMGSLVLLLAPMVSWKLVREDFSIAFNVVSHDALEMLSASLANIDFARDVIAPVGLSFATFRGVDLLIKSYLGQIRALSYERVLFYGFFPAVQVSGPIIEYGEVAIQGDKPRKPSTEDIYVGLWRIAVGMLKVFVIAVFLGDSVLIFRLSGIVDTGRLWLYLFVYAWFFYINFSGYSDLAIGVSRLFGFKLKENFNFPFFRENIAEFWNNWHMSLSRFAQRNAFVALGGYRERTQYIAIFGTIMVIAMWHDLSLGMLVFGAYHGVGLILHRFFVNRRGRHAVVDTPQLRAVKIACTHFYVVLSFPLLALPLESANAFYLALLGL